MKRDDIETVAGLLRGARRVLFITGAGVSADSGLPTYRGVGGLYESEHTPEGLPVEEILSGRVMRSHPEITWKYLREIESSCRGARPNRAHEVIADLERLCPTVWVLTQNVDGLHRRAGSSHVIDIHGDVHTIVCPACGHRFEVEDFAELAPLPICPRCGGVMRPDVVLFGELLPPRKIAVLEEQLRTGFDVILSVGTSSLFAYVAGPVLEAAGRGTPTVEINPDETSVSRAVRVRLPMRAAAACEAIWSALTSP